MKMSEVAVSAFMKHYYNYRYLPFDNLAPELKDNFDDYEYSSSYLFGYGDVGFSDRV